MKQLLLNCQLSTLRSIAPSHSCDLFCGAIGSQQRALHDLVKMTIFFRPAEAGTYDELMSLGGKN